jgi:hypothetical protein
MLDAAIVAPSAVTRSVSNAVRSGRPSEPPSCCAVMAVAEATPSLPCGTPVLAATYIVVKATPCPRPATTTPGIRSASDPAAGRRRYKIGAAYLRGQRPSRTPASQTLGRTG